MQYLSLFLLADWKENYKEKEKKEKRGEKNFLKTSGYVKEEVKFQKLTGSQIFQA